MINLYALKYFCDTHRLGSMTEAANVNLVSRSAISQSIKKLENELQIQLLDHKRRGLQFTSKGLALARKAENIFDEIEKTTIELRQGNLQIEGDLRLGSAQVLATFFLQDILDVLKKDHPELRVRARIKTSQALVRNLANREFDLAFFIGDETRAGFEECVIRKGFFKLMRPKKLSIDKVQYALTDSRPETERVATLFQQKFNKKLPVYTEISSWDTIMSWMKEGRCGGLVPDLILSRDSKLAKNFIVVLDKIWPYEIKIMYASNRQKDPAIRAFVEAAKTIS